MGGVWVGIAGILYLALKSDLGKKIPDKELLLKSPRRVPEKFPVWFGYIYAVIVVVSMILVIMSLFYVPNVVVWLQKIFYWKENVLYIFNSDTTIWSMLPSFFVALAMLAFTLKLIVIIFPKFDRYQALVDRFNYLTRFSSKTQKNEVWKFAINKIDLNKLAFSEWRLTVLISFIVWLMCGPIFILAADTYVFIMADHLLINPFLGLTEKKYYFDDIRKVKINLGARTNSYNEVSVSPSFDLEFKDGRVHDIWQGVGLGSPPAESLIGVAELLKQNGVQFEVDPIDTVFEAKAIEKYDSQAQSTVHAFFEYIKTYKGQ